VLLGAFRNVVREVKSPQKKLYISVKLLLLLLGFAKKTPQPYSHEVLFSVTCF
jgi:hypothetical protein